MTTPAQVLLPSVLRGGQPAFPAAYVAAVRHGGARPVVVTPHRLQSESPVGVEVRSGASPAPGTFTGIHGLLLPGGGDLNPLLYGQLPDPRTHHVTPWQDEFEIGLLRLALAARLPILAICRGMQLLNVCLGGTLVQHLPDGPVRHRGQTVRDPSIRHPVEVAPGSRLAGIIGAYRVVNSRHHQALGRLGAGLRVTARSDDGIAEAVELQPDPFVLGVQWHPEDMFGADAGSEELFAAFTAAAQEVAQAGRAVTAQPLAGLMREGR